MIYGSRLAAAQGARQHADCDSRGRQSELLSRGEVAVDSRDIDGARRLLKLPAECGNPQAQRLLAQTFDPVWLVRGGVLNWEIWADPITAVDWYKRAAQNGDANKDNRYLQASQ